MPLGHLVDIFWRWKGLLVYLGAALIAASLLIMYGLISDPQQMTRVMGLEAWFVFSTLLAPFGYVIQNSVADAMSVEAVPRGDAGGKPLRDDVAKSLHTTMPSVRRWKWTRG